MTAEIAHKKPSDYIRHRGPLLLLDSIEMLGPNSVKACALIERNNIFFDQTKDGVPSWVGLEYLAQTAAVWVGINDESNNRPIQLGFLLGSRSYEAATASFSEGKELNITIKADFIDGNIVVFSGEIVDNTDSQLASGNLTAFRPDDVDSYLKGEQ